MEGVSRCYNTSIVPVRYYYSISEPIRRANMSPTLVFFLFVLVCLVITLSIFLLCIRLTRDWQRGGGGRKECRWINERAHTGWVLRIHRQIEEPLHALPSAESRRPFPSPRASVGGDRCLLRLTHSQETGSQHKHRHVVFSLRLASVGCRRRMTPFWRRYRTAVGPLHDWGCRTSSRRSIELNPNQM